MNILDMLLNDEQGRTLTDLSNQFGLDTSQTRKAVGELVPALSRGLTRNTEEPKGLDELLDALETGNHDRYLNEPGQLDKTSTRDDGNDILGHIFGDKKVSRKVAQEASQRSGISSTLLKKMLPVVASLVMGALSKKMLGGNRRVNRANSGGILASLLDADGDGSIWDDILKLGARTLLK
ncbi:MAG: DUF937 domain-containing protein [Gammaproteobacteria bacterium]|nr:DUF937 domain-containing protein [Gammaproteobacteria bacterium]